jgi:hypothetical protein
MLDDPYLSLFYRAISADILGFTSCPLSRLSCLFLLNCLLRGRTLSMRCSVALAICGCDLWSSRWIWLGFLLPCLNQRGEIFFTVLLVDQVTVLVFAFSALPASGSPFGKATLPLVQDLLVIATVLLSEVFCSVDQQRCFLNMSTELKRLSRLLRRTDQTHTGRQHPPLRPIRL